MTKTETLTLIQANWPKVPGLHAISTTRTGGISMPPYHSLNMGQYIPDDKNAIHTNRERVAKHCEFPSTPCYLKQVHGTRVLDDNFNPEDNEADAMVSFQKNRVLAILTADCLPILLYGKTHHDIAAIHSGWRSLAGGIIEQTIKKLKSPAQSLMAWLGPCIGPNAFEVGDDVREAFKKIDITYESAFTPHGDKWLANLPLLARHQLESHGISSIYSDNSCTFTEKERFFSYRRDKTTGRMASFIWLT